MRRKISDLKVAELKLELEKRGLESKGLKGALVQRLQKAVDDEGGSTSEIDVSSSDAASPKPRRGTPRPRRTPEIESEPAQETEVSVTISQDKTEEKAFEDVVESAPSEVADANANGVVEEVETLAVDTSTYDVIDGDNATLEDDQEDGQVDEVIVSEEVTADVYDEYVEEMDGEGKDNDFRAFEEPIDDSVEVDEEHLGSDGEQAKIEEDIEEEAVESAIQGESGDAEASSAEDFEGEEEVVEEPVEMPENCDITEKVECAEDMATDLELKQTTEKVKTDGKEQEVVVTAEVDVLDMLDYDLEITGDQNNINVQSEDHASKAAHGSGEKMRGQSTKNEKSADDKARREALRSPTAPTTEKKARQASDSQKKPNAPAVSSTEQQKAGGQSSTKSSAAASKESSKSVSGSKREGTGGSSASRKDDNPNKNLWISGLSSTTRASELKSAFSRYGKVIGAKVVTNVKSPGARCYGYVTMATVEAASKCILHLNSTEMHGRMITVEIAKGDPSASSKKQQAASSGTSLTKKDAESKDQPKGKDSESKLGTTSTRRPSATTQASGKTDKDLIENKNESEKKVTEDQSKDGVSSRKINDDGKKTGRLSPARSRTERTSSAGAPRSGDKRHIRSPAQHTRSSSASRYGQKEEPDRKRARQLDGDRKVVMDSNKGELRVNVSGSNRIAAAGGERWPNRQKPLVTRRRSASPVRRRPAVAVRSLGTRGRSTRGDFKSRSTRGRGGLITRQTTSSTYTERNQATHTPARSNQILSFSQIRAQQRERERARGADRGRGRGGFSQGQLHVDRDRLRREREEREKLRLERERLERERRQLEKDRQERERLEQERLRLEQERKRELERIEREKAEMRRLQEITRYEVEQRQRAIKRTYDDDVGSSGHRGNRSSNRDGYDSKRVMMSDRDMRTDGRRGDRDDRRGYESYSRDTSRNGPQPPPTTYRTSQGSYRGAGDTGGRGKSTAYHHDSRRGVPVHSDPHHDTDARYSVSGSSGSGINGRSTGRSVEKYERRETNRTIDYGHGFERESAGDSRHVETSPARRRGPQRDSSNHRDGRKVVRERPDHRGGASPEYRRGARGGNARVEITREQSPPAPARRSRRGSTPPASTRSSSWREGKGSSSRREDDRDLREQIRGRQSSASLSGSYAENSRERTSQRRAASDDSSSPSPVRSSGQYQSRWPESATDASATQQIYAVTNASAIPTQTGRSGGANAGWHVAAWQQQSATQSARAWPGSTLATAASPVGRQILATPPYGAVGSAPALGIVPPGTTMNPATQAYIPSADRQSRSFQASYKQLTRRY